MRGYIFSCLFLVSALMVADGGAQIPADTDKPVWTMEVIKVKLGKFGPTLSYLDDNWVRIREEAKRQGAVLDYHRIAEEGVSEREDDQNIILLTEYKNHAAYNSREKLFASIVKKLPNNTAGRILLYQHEDLYETVKTRIYNDYTEANTPRFRLLAKN